MRSLYRHFAILIVLCTIPTIAPAQEHKEWSGGAKMNIYTGWDGATGLGLYARYGLGSGFRLEPSFTLLGRTGMSIDLTTDLHYPFSLSKCFELYPLVGISLNDPGTFGVGVNFGGGLGYIISNRVNLDLGLKWTAQTQRHINNSLIISIGGGYKF